MMHVTPDRFAESGARPLRVLVVHNRYQVRGGEDAVVEREIEALARAGQEVEAEIFDNDAIQSLGDRLRTAYEAPHAPRAIARVLATIDRVRPDVVHAHNLFPLVSPALHAAVRARGVATVQTLHNFRTTCANGILLRDGRPCEDCVTGSAYNAVLHRCYRGSALGSLAVARLIETHRKRGTWHKDVDRFIILSEFARSRFVAAGLPGERMRVKPNGLADPGPPGDGPRAGILYVGRLSNEKGIETLAEAAPLTRAPITVIGEGPLAARVQGIPNLAAIGPRDRAAVQAAMLGAQAVVVPSICYEGLPMVIAEAFAAGTPVVASRIGALAGLVEDGVTGLHAEPGDAASLARALDRIVADPVGARRMGVAARAAYRAQWSEEAVTASLLSIYAEAAAHRAADRGV